jgi:hypothetical protein
VGFKRIRRRQLLIGIVVIIAGLVLGWTSFGNGPDDKLERKISEIVQQKRGTEKEVIIVLSTITSFQWDMLYVFEPYTTPDTINGTLGFQWGKSEKTGISSSYQIDLLVFVRKGKVVNYVEHNRSDGDFLLSNNNGFDPKEARFTVSLNYQVDAKGWLELHQVN